MRLRTRTPTLKRWAILGCPSGTGIWLRDNRKSPAQILVALDWKVRAPKASSVEFSFAYLARLLSPLLFLRSAKSAKSAVKSFADVSSLFFIRVHPWLI